MKTQTQRFAGAWLRVLDGGVADGRSVHRLLAERAAEHRGEEKRDGLTVQRCAWRFRRLVSSGPIYTRGPCAVGEVG
jgi:hypothetical protein